MQAPISSVIVKERVRRETGDLAPLTESMQKYGQLSPLVLTRKNELIAGHRRFLAAKRLGWYTVDVVYVDRDSDVEKLEMELQENVHRKDFSPEELLEGYSRLEKLKKPPFLKRVATFFRGIWVRLFSRKKHEPTPQTGTQADSGAGKSGTEPTTGAAPYDFEDSEFNP